MMPTEREELWPTAALNIDANLVNAPNLIRLWLTIAEFTRLLEILEVGFKLAPHGEVQQRIGSSCPSMTQVGELLEWTCFPITGLGWIQQFLHQA